MKPPHVIHLINLAIVIFLPCVLISHIITCDTARFAVIPCTGEKNTGSGPGCWTPASADVVKADSIIIDCIAQQCRETEFLHVITKNGIGNYYRQYAGTFGDKGEKLVRINCMCTLPGTGEDWKRNIIITHGGGHCYFNAVVNLESMKCEELHVNSPR